MKKYFLLFLFGIACSGIKAQVDENSISTFYTDIVSGDPMIDSSNVEYGMLNISFNISDTVQLKSIQIQLDDEGGHPLLNFLQLKNELIQSGFLSGNVLNIKLERSLRIDEEYVARITYHNLIGSNEQTVVYSVTNQ